MDACFSISVDPDRDLLHITLAGFFSVDDVARFSGAITTGLSQLHCGPNRHLTLVDIREMKIQSQSSVGEFQRVLVNARTRGRAIAFVVAQSLARMQAQRVASERFSAYFETQEQAKNWLFTQHRAAA